MDKLVSIIIACRNEEKFIAECLDSLIANDYPKDKMEILIIDGASKDKTKEIVQKYIERYSFIKVFDNPQRITPISLNIGIKNSQGEFIVILGAHAYYNKDYISKSVKRLIEFNVDGIGGSMKAIVKKKTLIAKSIAKVLSSPFGTGNSYFKIDYKKVKHVDALFGSCYKREVYDKVGLYNEKFARSQDLEFNLRLKKAGGKILFVPDIISYYYPVATLKNFIRHNLLDGIWSTYPLKFSKKSFSIRHYIPLIFVLSLLIAGIFSLYIFLTILTIYLLTALYFSLRILLKEKDIRLLFSLPLVFAVRHICYGFGAIIGFFWIGYKKT